MLVIPYNTWNREKMITLTLQIMWEYGRKYNILTQYIFGKKGLLALNSHVRI